MKMLKRYLILAGIVIVIAAIAAGGLYFFFKGNFSGEAVGSSTVVNIANLQEQVLSIGELATIEYDYTNVIDSKTSHTIKGWNVPGTAKSFIVVLDGTMKIGIDASGITVEESEGSQSILITIPKAKILSHEIHEDTLKVLDQKSGLFNPVKIEDYTSLAATEKKEMETKAATGDLFPRAEKEASKMIQQLIGAGLPDEYTVEVVVAKAAE